MGIFNRFKEATKVLLGKAQAQVITVATPKEDPTPKPVTDTEDVQAATNISKPVQVEPTSVVAAKEDSTPPCSVTAAEDIPVAINTPQPVQVKPAPIVAAPKPPVARALPAYAVKHSKFKEFSDRHREHQTNAIAACDGKDIGQISIPTGTGKSRIQEHLHLEDMLFKAETKTPGVYVIAAHRLALCKQLLTDLIELVAACHLPFDVVFVGSDRVDEDAIYEKHMAEDVSKKSTYVTASTKQAEIKSAVSAAHKDGRNVLIVSTYHSFNKLAVLDNISMVTYDEAHTIASSRTSDDNFEAHVKEVQDKGSIQRQFFFTATRKVSGDDKGMNDQSIYGPVIYEEPPIKMILAGEIVPPRIHRVTTADDGEFNNDTMLVKTIIDAFSEHRNAVHNASPLAKKLGAKLLVSAEGTPSVNHLRENDEFRGWCFRNKVRLFLFSSVLGNFMFDKDTWRFRKSNRDETIAAMQAMPLEEDAILVHIDILAEGIDLPAITGVLPFRELNLIKLLQTIGRGARLIPEDRKALYSGKVQPMEWHKMIKPYCWVIFPKLASSESSTMDATIKKVLEAYDAPKMEFSREDEYKGYPDPELDPITPRDETSRKDPETALLHTLEDLMIGAAVQPPRTTLTAQLAAVNPALLIP